MYCLTRSAHYCTRDATLFFKIGLTILVYCQNCYLSEYHYLDKDTLEISKEEARLSFLLGSFSFAGNPFKI